MDNDFRLVSQRVCLKNAETWRKLVVQTRALRILRKRRFFGHRERKKVKIIEDRRSFNALIRLKTWARQHRLFCRKQKDMWAAHIVVLGMNGLMHWSRYTKICRAARQVLSLRTAKTFVIWRKQERINKISRNVITWILEGREVQFVRLFFDEWRMDTHHERKCEEILHRGSHVKMQKVLLVFYNKIETNKRNAKFLRRYKGLKASRLMHSVFSSFLQSLGRAYKRREKFAAITRYYQDSRRHRVLHNLLFFRRNRIATAFFATRSLRSFLAHLRAYKHTCQDLEKLEKRALVCKLCAAFRQLKKHLRLYGGSRRWAIVASEHPDVIKKATKLEALEARSAVVAASTLSRLDADVELFASAAIAGRSISGAATATKKMLYNNKNMSKRLQLLIAKSKKYVHVVPFEKVVSWRRQVLLMSAYRSFHSFYRRSSRWTSRQVAKGDQQFTHRVLGMVIHTFLRIRRKRRYQRRHAIQLEAAHTNSLLLKALVRLDLHISHKFSQRHTGRLASIYGKQRLLQRGLKAFLVGTKEARSISRHRIRIEDLGK